jgi:uncharacterized protein YndB with AHSA1/START domain
MMDSPKLGRVSVDGDYATLTFERRLEHGPQEVWEAITQPEQLGKWYMTDAKIEGRVGGKVDFLTGQLHITGAILAWNPPRVFEHEWNVEARGDFPSERSVIRWEIFPEDYGSLLKMTHSHLTKRTSQGFVAGAHAFLDRLEAHLDEAPLPDWMARLKELRPAYARAQGQQNPP